ncbi:Glutamate--tRNA ligase 1 [Crateriforma conspicua]|uniref:Glutamate--tRNA ligase 1 n=1 Tax=Crateriforma conspicua TaxID=2527996 RepID=A0A5C6G1Z8_9PLAN|nr:tRNA glutamyl-Q(34) synthetase GluQRS [Crateriforma conspicua]TWU67193.1 Glutamate--tRNA ligase 1 [Crateriforma conspicua]
MPNSDRPQRTPATKPPHDKTSVKGRLAPSPTGAQHPGNARTYLVAHWSMIRQSAPMVLRIEDIDSPRVKPWAIQQAIDDLRWLGIEWDEGPDVGGPSGPYIQTQRTDRYDQAIAKLRSLGRVYPCTCTRRDIESAASAPHAEFGHMIYPGLCSDWTEGDPIPAEGTYCWRFRVRDQVVHFDDAVAGSQSLNPSRDLGDVPVTRKTGEAAYQLAVILDDDAMGVTEVVRGDDLIDSTFWQIELADALGLSVPSYAHVPLVIGDDGRRLAKRHGDTRLDHLRRCGVDPQDVILWAAGSLGIGDLPTAGEWETDRLHRHIAAQMNWTTVNRDRVVVPSKWTRLG